MHSLTMFEVQRLIRFMRKAVFDVHPDWDVGGLLIVHVVCYLSLAGK